MMHVSKNMVVSIRYIMRNSRDEILENNMQGVPVNYLHGSDAILPSLQKQLESSVRGDKKIVYLSAAQDDSPEDFAFEVTIDDVRQALPEEIMLGYPVLINNDICNENCECHEK
jgi:hypothetical protein